MKYNIEFTPQELQLVVNCLHEAPFRLVSGLINSIQKQVSEQEADKPAENGS